MELLFKELGARIVADCMLYGKSGEVLVKPDLETNQLIIYYRPPNKDEFERIKL